MRIWVFIVSMLVFSACTRDLGDDLSPDRMQQLAAEASKDECAQGFEGPRCMQRQADRWVGKYAQGRKWCLDGTDKVIENIEIMVSAHDALLLEIDDHDFYKPLLAEFRGWNIDLVPQTNYKKLPDGLHKMTAVGVGWIDLKNNQLIYQLISCGCQVELPYREKIAGS